MAILNIIGIARIGYHHGTFRVTVFFYFPSPAQTGFEAGVPRLSFSRSGRRFAAALLPRLFGKNPRSHHKGATGRVRTEDQRLPVLCHCQLGQDIHWVLWTLSCFKVKQKVKIYISRFGDTNTRMQQFRVQLNLQIPDGRNQNATYESVRERLLANFSNLPYFQVYFHGFGTHLWYLDAKLDTTVDSGPSEVPSTGKWLRDKIRMTILPDGIGFWKMPGTKWL